MNFAFVCVVEEVWKRKKVSYDIGRDREREGHIRLAMIVARKIELTGQKESHVKQRKSSLYVNWSYLRISMRGRSLYRSRCCSCFNGIKYTQ